MRLRRHLAAILSIIGVLSVHACGPFFPYSYIAFGRERDVLKLPEAWFHHELSRVLNYSPEAVWKSDADAAREQSKNADVNGLIESLNEAGIPADVATPIVESYRTARAQTPPSAANLHELLPREFTLYAEGAAAYHAENLDEALAKWKDLLALPPDQRWHKSVWAEYMIGRTLRDRDATQANAAFERARELAAEGFPDPLELAAEGLGWQAYLDYHAGNIAGAIRRYAEQYKLGKTWSQRAYTSLSMICRDAFDSAETLSACAADESVRDIVTVWAVSHPNTGTAVKPWLESLFANAPLSEIPQADALAWAAYSMGDFESARRLLDAPSAATPYGKRVRTKLLLRAGKIDEAMALMREILPDFPNSVEAAHQYHRDTAPLVSVEAELGVLLLGRQEYTDAFDAFLRSGFWLDAAYIGDRILTIDELRQYVDAHSQDSVLAERFRVSYYVLYMWGDRIGTEDLRPTLADLSRYMLARRLARNNRWAEAIPYFPAAQVESAKELIAARVAGKADEPPTSVQSYWEKFIGAKPRTVVDRARAKALYTAATLTRERGIALLGTEVTPDWHVFGGALDISGFYGLPQRWKSGQPIPKELEAYTRLEPLNDATARTLAPSEDELRRFRESAPQPNHRFHYRYTAADLMWQSALNLPDNDIETMRALYTGGKYLLSMDDYRAANKFYRSLVWRNLNMPYAQLADRQRWFPNNPPE